MTSWQTKQLEAQQAHAEGLNRAKQGQYGWMVDHLNPSERYDYIVVANGKGGCAINLRSKELVGVWSSGGGLLGRILAAALAAGAEWLTCYDAGLVQLYEEHGWTVTDRAAFNPLFAPADWPGTSWPDYVTMRRPV